MTLDEAIQHAEQMASKLPDCECGRQHAQLAKWLRDYRRLLATTNLRSPEKIAFEAICNELAAILDSGNKIDVSFYEGKAFFRLEDPETGSGDDLFTILPDGSLVFDDCNIALEAKDLTAIAAACQEIAANNEAEHRKENKHEQTFRLVSTPWRQS